MTSHETLTRNGSRARSRADRADVTTPIASSANDTTTALSRSIVLCATPGAGEAHVSDLLNRCGAGDVRPYLDLETVAPPLLARFGVEQVDEYITALHQHHSTPDGVFGLLVGWHDIRRLLRRVVGPRQSTPQRVLEIIEVVAPEPTFVHLRRKDRASHVLALHTWQQQRRGAPRNTQSALPPDEPRLLDALIAATDTVWTQWFDAIGRDRVEVTYEDLVDSPDAQHTLATRLGLVPATASSEPASA